MLECWKLKSYQQVGFSVSTFPNILYMIPRNETRPKNSGMQIIQINTMR